MQKLLKQTVGVNIFTLNIFFTDVLPGCIFLKVNMRGQMKFIIELWVILLQNRADCSIE